MSASNLKGWVDYFDGKTIGGWALNTDGKKTPISVDIYINDCLAITALSNRHREDLKEISDGFPDKGFWVSLNENSLLLALPKITVKYHGTDKELAVIDRLSGLLNNKKLSLDWLLKSAAGNRYLPTPPLELIRHVGSVSEENFRQVGMIVAADLFQYGLLANPNHTIADIGCGCGRIALFIAPALSNSGRYYGFDTWSDGIKWATENVTAYYPNCTFKVLTLSREESGYRSGSSYILDLQDSSCDFVLATSLFTHLRYDATRSYFKEIYRIMKPGASAYLTFYIYDEESRHAIPYQELEADEHGYYYVEGSYAVSYFKEKTILDLIGESHLIMHLKKLGFWRGEKFKEDRWPAGYQDLCIVKKD